MMYEIKKVNLDEKDKKILHFLMNDPRTSVADIAREVGAQRDTVLYRIKRLERKGVIGKYHTIIEPQALGLNMFVLVLIKLTPIAGTVVTEFVQGLAALKNVTHVARLIGAHDYFVQIAVEDAIALDTVLSQIKTIKSGVVASLEVSNIIDGIKTDDFSGLI